MDTTNPNLKDASRSRMSRLLRLLSFVIRPPKIGKPRLHSLKLLFRRSTPRQATKPETPHHFGHHLRLLFRTRNKEVEKKKGEPRIFHALSQPPSFNISTLKRRFEKTKLYFQLFFKRPQKQNAQATGIAKFYEMSFSQRVFYDLRKSFDESRISVLLPVQRYWKSAIILLAFSPLLFEIFLQGTSLLAWSMLQLRSAIVPAQKEVILCIGDSYTSGRFTSSQIKPYPDFLKQVTRRKVVNYSSAFMDSVEVLENLRAVLEKQQPALVYVMVGLNDFLNSDPGPIVGQPGPLTEDQRYIRTALVVKNLRKESLVPAVLDTFIAPAPFFLKTPEEDKRSVDFSGEAFRRVLRLSSATQNYSADASLTEKQNSVMDQLEDSTLDQAKAYFEEEARTGDNLFAHVGMTEIYFKTGSHSEARKQIAWLMSKYQTHSDIKSAHALLKVYGLENPVKDSLRVTIGLLKQFPGDPWIWEKFALYAHLSNRPDFASRAITQALALAPQGFPLLRADILRTQAQILRASNPELALQALIQSFLLDGNQDLFINSLQSGYLRYQSLNVRKVLDHTSCPQEKKEMLLHLMDQGLDRSIAAKAAAFHSRIREIARVCQEYGARAVFVTYPFPYPMIEDSMLRAAQETDSGWLNLSTSFESLLRDPERRKRILKEGNFIEGGSQKIADIVAADVEFRQPE